MMSTVMQMGHDTRNLVGEEDLHGFTGIVLSPVNRGSEDLATDVPVFKDRGDFKITLDPQLYVPRSDRGFLPEYTYFPADIDSSDLTSASWWHALVQELAEYSERLGVDTLASPAVLPRSWDDEYYALCLQVANDLAGLLHEKQDVLQTVVVDLATLGNPETALRIASIVSGTRCAGCYLVIVCSEEPRREIKDPQGLAGAMYLIRLLENAGKPVLVAYSSSDMVLYKAAGASHCGTGKFFNLRRFTESRFGEPTDGGGQLAYWFEHSLLAFLRESDIRLLSAVGRSDLLGEGFSDNVWTTQIREVLAADKGKAWVRLGWRQYLSWFWRTERELADEPFEKVKAWLEKSERRWLELEDNEVLLEDPRNDGGWLRPWRQALNVYGRLVS
jgi:hypothetical protein